TAAFPCCCPPTVSTACAPRPPRCALIWEEPGDLERLRLHHWSTILDRESHTVDHELLARAHALAFEVAVGEWHANRQFTADHAAELMRENLRLQLSPEVQAELAFAFSAAGLETPLRTAVGVRDALMQLRELGIKIGIVCDVGLTPSPVLRAHLDKRGLLNLFDHWSFSDETGAYKPDETAFRHACEGLDVAPANVAHIGDQRRTDVAGALGAGLTAVRYTGIFDDPNEDLPSGDAVINGYDQLLQVLGLG
ncbi:HAD family hydrolase, partial [Nocardia salmonicida]|uniref:HAD family hydrolase n=1 Tax=Nocardia salmonicida TaxID=53431 RepID=UPI003408C528